MIVIPKEKPVIQNINSYYIDLKKLFEHCQGEFGAGGIYFQSKSVEGIFFFDADDLLNGVFHDKEGEIQGDTVLEHLIEVASDHNFTISIYKIDSRKVYFWSNISQAKRIYKDLSTDFTDLEGLINKMSAEKLTGYIDVTINNGNEGGLIFFCDGKISGGSYSWGNGDELHSEESLNILLQKSKELGGVFHVSKILQSNEKRIAGLKEQASHEVSSTVLTLLEELLNIFERMISANKKVKRDFNSQLKMKFIEKADKYPFLDPFASEFKYSDHKITFVGQVEDKDIADGVIESINEIADDLGVLSQFRTEFTSWSKKYESELLKLNII